MSQLDPAGDDLNPTEEDIGTLVDVAREHAKDREEAQSTEAPPPKSKGRILTLLLIPLVLTTSWSVWSLTRPAPPLAPQVQEASLAGILYVLAQQLDRHHAENGSYPASLDEISPPLDGITYSLEEDGYLLEATANGMELSYGSWEDAGALLMLAGSPALMEIGR